MRSPVPFLVVAAAALLAACGSTGSSGGGGGDAGDASGDGLGAGAPAVTGNTQVVIRTWNPNNPSAPPTTAALVNASSESGRRLQSGRASSTVVRVITDQQMGALLAALDEKGFSANATDGVALDKLTPDARRRGVIVVERDGAAKGMEFFPKMSETVIPRVFTDCKQIIFSVHSAVPGYEVRATTSATDDPSRLFQAPPARLPNR